jgi:hypothetical protein
LGALRLSDLVRLNWMPQVACSWSMHIVVVNATLASPRAQILVPPGISAIPNQTSCPGFLAQRQP